MANDFNDLNKEIAELTALQQGLASKLKDQEKGIKAFNEAAITGAGQLAKGLGSWTKAVGEGDTSFASLNAVVDIATNALSNMAKAIPIVGAGLSQTAKAAGEAGKFMLGQLDTTTKAFNQMGQYSALGAKGMTGLKDQFTGARLPLETLGKIVGENAATFARWQGTTASGTDAFSEIVGDLTDKGDLTLRRLGMSAEQIGQTAAAYISQQTRLGQSQRMTNEELVKGTKAYAQDLDQLQKLTGQSAGSIKSQQDKMLNQARFRANIDEMIAEGHGDNARAIQNFQSEIAVFNEAVGQGIADLVSGTSETGTKGGELMALTGGAALDIVRRLKEGKISQAQASNELKDSLKEGQSRNLQLAKSASIANAGTDMYAATSDIVSSQDSKAADRAKTAQKKQLAGSDKLTEKTISAQQHMENMNMELQKLSFEALPYTVMAVDAVSKTIDSAVQFIMDRIRGGSSDQDIRAAEIRRSAGAGGAVSTVVGAGGAIVGGAGGEGEGAAIMEAAASAPAPTATPAKPGQAPVAGPAKTKEDLANKIMMAESGGKNIANRSGEGGKATSTATGLFQFTKETFEDLAKTAAPDSPLYGKTFDDYKNDLTLQRSAMNVLMEKNASSLAKRGIETTDANMYLAHFLGAGGAARALLAGPNAPLTDVMSPKQLDANPSLKSMKTVADLQAWADKKMGGSEATASTPYKAAEGAVLSGPAQGYNPNKSMSGVDVKPLNKSAMDAANMANGQASMDPQMFGLQMEQLDLLIASAKNQLAVKQRILKAKA